MKNIDKLAQLFEKTVEKEKDGEDLFGELSYKKEAKYLTALAGKLKYKSNKNDNHQSVDKLVEAARLVLLAADLLKKL